jgi:ABC-type bacteriocin/lantibiotic exporter with double-glycine peptidase domain
MVAFARVWALLLSAAGAPGGTQAIWLDVPFVAQEENGCGAACVAMVMKYWRDRTVATAPLPSDSDIYAALSPDPRGGTRASDLVRYLTERGFQAFAFAGTWDDLEQHLRKGRPLIAGLKKGSGAVPFHFVVIAGLDRGEDLILVNDPARRKLSKLSRADFDREWKGCGNWTLLALPRQD